MRYGVADAKNNLPKLIKAALRGEQVIISSRGADAVELVPVRPKEATGQSFGSMPHLQLPPEWEHPSHDDVSDFEGL